MTQIFVFIIAFSITFSGLYYLGSCLEKELDKDKKKLISDIADEVIARLKKE